MLSIQRTRELIPDSEKYTDQEIEELRDHMRAWAELIFEQWKYDRQKQKEANNGQRT